MLIGVMNNHGLEQFGQFPTRETITLDIILTSLSGQFYEIHSPDKLCDYDVTCQMPRPHFWIYIYLYRMVL